MTDAILPDMSNSFGKGPMGNIQKGMEARRNIQHEGVKDIKDAAEKPSMLMQKPTHKPAKIQPEIDVRDNNDRAIRHQRNVTQTADPSWSQTLAKA